MAVMQLGFPLFLFCGVWLEVVWILKAMSSSNERIPLRKEEMKKGLFHSPISSVLIMFVLVLHGIETYVKVRVHGWEELQAYRCWAEFSILGEYIAVNFLNLYIEVHFVIGIQCVKFFPIRLCMSSYLLVSGVYFELLALQWFSSTSIRCWWTKNVAF